MPEGGGHFRRFRFKKFGLQAVNKEQPSALSLSNEGRLVHLSPVQGSGAKGFLNRE